VSSALTPQLCCRKGVTIEASPVSFRRLVQSRKDTLAVNAAICANHTTVHYVHHGDKAYHGRLDGVYEFMPPHFRQHWYNNVAMPEQALPVVCAPLSAIFMKLGLKHIHFLILDADGGELAILMTIDFSAVHIDVLCVEQDGTNPEKDGLVRQLLEEQGYRLKFHSGETYVDQISRNDWYVHAHFQPVSAPTFG